MSEVILIKQGEMVLKGLNRTAFEKRLLLNTGRALKGCGTFRIYAMQSTVYIEPQEPADMEEAFRRSLRIFGAATVTRAASCAKSLPEIVKTAEEYLKNELLSAKTYKVETRRADKTFPYKSPEISAVVGGALGDAYPHLRVDVGHPDVLVMVEIRDKSAYVHAQAAPGAGGMPAGIGGRAALLLSGGIDSPVAGYMMAKRGLSLEAVHFFSYPYTSERAKRKVLALAELLSAWCGPVAVHVVPFTEIQEQIRSKCPEEMFTVVMRRFMMRIAERIARKTRCGALITGESLGQVASQTMEAMGVTGQVCALPVFRPAIGMDKEEIVAVARRIGTYETSILPYEDCCTVFTPRHPKTKPRLEDAVSAERELDVDALVHSAAEGAERFEFGKGENQ